MNSDTEDPNNHAPQVSPSDEWDEVESGAEIPKVQLPPIKKIKEAFVYRHEPKSVAPRTTRVTSDSENEEESESGVASSPDLSETKEESDSQDLDDGTRLPPAPIGKKSRLNFSIGPGEVAESDPRPEFRPIQTIPDSPDDSSGENSDDEVARMRRRYVSGERQDWGEGRARGSAKWMIYTGAGVVLLVVLAVTLSQTLGTKPSSKSNISLLNRLTPAEAEPAKGTESFDLLEILNNSVQEAKDMYGKYASALTSAEFSGVLFRAEEVLPLVEKNWKSSGVKPGWIPGQDAEWTVLDSNGTLFGVLRGTHPDFTDFSAFFRNQGQGLIIDWKATAAYGTATFDEMKSGAGDGSEVRTWISPAEFYTFALPEGEFRSYRLTSPDRESDLWAYAPRDGDLDKKLVALFSPSQITGEVRREAQVTLGMEPGPEEGLPNQWVIQNLTSLDWLDQLQK